MGVAHLLRRDSFFDKESKDMNYTDIAMLFSLILFCGVIGSAIGFGLGRRSAYCEVSQNLGDPKHPRSLIRSSEWTGR